MIEIDDNDEYGMRCIKQEPKGETSRGFKLEDINPSLLKWIPGYEAKKKEKETEKNQPIIEEIGKTSVYIPKTRPDKTVVLVENVGVKSTDRRSGRTVLVPKSQRRGDKYYCDECKSEFSRKDVLAKHIKFDCLQEVCQFICDMCQAAYYSDVAVREHYYQIHLKEDLYFCKKYGQGFAHKSRKSVHQKSGACPMKDEDDKFPGRAPFNEKLEATFKCRVIMPLEIMEGDVQQEQEGQQLEQQQQEPDMGNEPEPGQSGVIVGQEVQEMEPIPTEPVLPRLPTGMSEDESAVEGLLGPLSEGNVPSTLMDEDEEHVVTLNLDIE